jgi:hypothetical protein
MTEASVSFAGNLTEDPEVRSTEGGFARAMFRVAVSGRREQEASFFTVVVWRDQAEHAAQSLTKAAGSWSWAGSSSGAGPLRTAAPDRSWRCWPRSWGQPALGDGDDDQNHEELRGRSFSDMMGLCWRLRSPFRLGWGCLSLPTRLSASLVR